MKKALIGCGVLAGIAVILLVAGAISILSGPESGVKLANEMDTYALEYLDQHKLLIPPEELVAYYDGTTAMDGTEAAILTTRRILFHMDGRTAAIDLADVDKVNHRTESLVGDVIEVFARSGKSLKIEIAPLNQGETFRSALMDAWERAKTGSNTGAKDSPGPTNAQPK